MIFKILKDYQICNLDFKGFQYICLNNKMLAGDNSKRSQPFIRFICKNKKKLNL